MLKPCVSQSGMIMSYPKEVYEMSMFFPNLTSREEAEKKVRHNYQGKGTYLLRPSSTGDLGYVSLSISETEFIIHHLKVNIEQDINEVCSFYVATTVQFPSLEQLLGFYSQCAIHVQEDINDLKLLHPVYYLPSPLAKSYSSRNQKDGASVVGGNSDLQDQNPMPVYLDLQGEDEHQEYLTVPIVTSSTPVMSKSHPLSVLTISQPPQSPQSAKKKAKEKSKLGIKSKVFSKSRSKSVCQTPSKPVEKTMGKKTRSFTQGDVLEEFPSHFIEKQHHCRPPAPLPPQNIPESDDFIYSYVDPDRDFFDETYKYLKENEVCECGLRLIDAELPDGWAVHYSKEEQTRDFIFFQHGDKTMWDIPKKILPLLSAKQEKLIVALCRKRPCPIPASLTEFIESKFSKLNLSSSPSQAAPNRKGSSSSGESAATVSSVSSSKAKAVQHKCKIHPKNSLSDNAIDDLGDYERADELFASTIGNSPRGNSQAKSMQAGQNKMSQEKPQPLARRSIQSGFQDPYVLEDPDSLLHQIGSNSSFHQDDERGSHALSSASPPSSSSSSSSPSSSDVRLSFSKQVKFKVAPDGKSETQERTSSPLPTVYAEENVPPASVASSHEGHRERMSFASPQTRSSESQQQQQQQQRESSSGSQKAPVRPPRRSRIGRINSNVDSAVVTDGEDGAKHYILQKAQSQQQQQQKQQQQLPSHVQPVIRGSNVISLAQVPEES